MSTSRQTHLSGTAGGPGNRQHSEENAAPQPTRGGRLTGEKAREKKLLEDELVIIISPQLVQCKRCAAEIKLSKKSQFDTFHWYQHRERCLKRPDAAVQEAKQKARPSPSPSPAWPIATKLHTKRREFTRSITPTAPTTSEDCSSSTTDTTESPIVLTPTFSFASPRMSATYELSHQAFQRVQQWTLRDIGCPSPYLHPLGEPYNDNAFYSSPHPCHLIKFRESQVRDTYD